MKGKTMKHIKISLFLLLVLVLFNNSVFGSDAKIYLKDDVIKKDNIFYDKKSNSKIDGVVKWFHKSGELERETLYKDGKAIFGFMYSEDGKKRKMTNAYLHKINQNL
jgi:antitoxin component YwqK of YwqJK toxin-antitoxin module